MRAASLLIALILTASIPLTSCTKDKPAAYQSSSILYFDTITTITGYAESLDAFNEFTAEAYSCLETYHRLYDIYHEYSGINNLMTVNKNAGIAPVEVDEKIIDLLEFCIDVYNLTDGKNNIAMGSVLSLWHEKREEALSYDDDIIPSTPDRAKLEAAAQHMDINKIIIDRENGTVYIEDPLMSIDVGSIAKGYATQRVCEYMESIGMTNAIFSVGGNICVIGPRTDGSGWTLGVQNPDIYSSEQYLCRLAMTEFSLVTSGVYQRYYYVGDVRYHHIINPDTLYPENTYTSVSIICPDSGLADALSTAVFNMSYEDGLRLIESMDNTEAMWVFADGEICYSSNFESYIID